ncbi:MAG TPA: hypothetical protein VMW24_24280 [Sedimentisphaerales bacterium]|nr:hypothetical protein [Sedimentisphaerales bacterium]
MEKKRDIHRAIMSDLSTVEIAKKQRHLHLLERIRQSKALSKVELDELEHYEMSARQKAQTAPAESTATRGNLTEASAQRLGLESKDLAEADARSGIGPNLAKYFARHPRLRAAFDRGRLLRNLVELAPVAMVHDAAKRLKDLGFTQFESAQNLRDFLDADAEARELWESARVNGWIGVRQSLWEAAKGGNAKAISMMEKWALDRQREGGEPGVNFGRVRVSQMAELFAVRRETIHEWYTQKGLPQNLDGTFDLHRAIPWYEDHAIKKAVRSRDAVSPLNPFQTVKTERERLRLEQDRGELIERGAVIGFQVSMLQNVANAFNAMADLANRVFGQPREQIVARLEEFGDEVMAKLQHVPAELKLTAAAEAKLIELYEAIKPQGPQKNAEKSNDE